MSGGKRRLFYKRFSGHIREQGGAIQKNELGKMAKEKKGMDVKD